MVPELIAPTGLETLSARPPTPPREKPHESDLALVKKKKQIASSKALHTPPSYSPVTSDLSNPTSRSIQKKVGFSGEPQYCDAPTYVGDGKRQPTPLSASSTISLSKPIRSILKPSPPVVLNSLDPLAGTDDASRHASFVTMLESNIKQLAGADRANRVDAYTILARALKTSNSLPDRIALRAKMGLFMQFIQRDITYKTVEGTADSSLAKHALHLLITFLHYPAIASALTNEFGVFIIDHCVRSFDDDSVPKDTVRQLGMVVSSQDFSPKVMTAERVGRLVAALHTIEDRVTGKSIIQGRLLNYQRLIRQAKPHMITYSDWITDLFTDMLSTNKDIRSTAVKIGLEASFTIAKEKQLPRKVMETLQLSVDDTKYIEFYIRQLEVMAGDKLESAWVPQIWCVVTLMMRHPLDGWEFYTPWLKIIQSCFNKSDPTTKYEANHAWNRWVYSLHANEQLLKKSMRVVLQPLASQIQIRRKVGNQSDELRRVVCGSICNLLYYGFKPDSSTSHVDSFWDACVKTLVLRMVSPDVDVQSSAKPSASSPDLVRQATLMLTGLFDSATPRLWKEDRVWHSALAKPEELSALDPKWVRRNAPRVFSIVTPIMSKTYLDLAQPDSDSSKLWRTLVAAVASAASKEIKVSTDTAVFVAHAFTLLHQIWSRGLAESEQTHAKSTTLFQATSMFLGTMIDALGLLPFTEKQLSMTKENTFAPLATPSHKAGKSQGLVRTPLYHLFSMLSTLPPGGEDGDSFANLINAVIEPFMSTKSPQAKVDLALELMQLLSGHTATPYGSWLLVSRVLSTSLKTGQMTQSISSPGSQPPLGRDFREIVKHLERGLRSTPNLSWAQWRSLFQLLMERVTEEAGVAGCAIAVIEPLAKVLMDIAAVESESKPSQLYLLAGIELMTNARHPRDRQALEAGRRHLWGTLGSGSRASSFDPFDCLYKVIDHFLGLSYKQCGSGELYETSVSLLSAVAGFLARCNQFLVFKALVNIQHGVGMWIQDADGRYDSRQLSAVSDAVGSSNGGIPALAMAHGIQVKLLWGRICNIFTEADNLEHVQLDTIEPLLCSAFGSRHRHIVNTVTTMWNQAFEQSDGIQYPEKLKAALLVLRPYVDIITPGLDVLDNEPSERRPSFIESQEEFDVTGPSIRTWRANSPQIGTRRSSSRRSTPGSVQLSVSKKREPEDTPEVGRTRAAKRNATPRARHDDSQIQFAAIVSSSPSINVESQVVTKRQREVRERQKENAALFPELRSSADERPSSSGSITPRTTRSQKKTTPKSHRTFEDYVSSTPTPRRGQALLVDQEQELTDEAPSSPPEPRRYPLLPELPKPQSSGSSLLDEWPPSSPIANSPSNNRRAMANQQQPTLSTDKWSPVPASSYEDPDEARPEAVDAAPEDAVEHMALEGAAHQGTSGAGHVLEAGGSGSQQAPEKPVAGLAGPADGSIPATRTADGFQNHAGIDEAPGQGFSSPRSLRSQAKASQQVVNSPVPNAQFQGPSFDASAVDERSMLRLAVELDSRRCMPAPTYEDESPEQSQEELPTPRRASLAASVGSERSSRKSKRSKTKANQSEPTSSAALATEESQSGGKKSKRKRRTISEDNEGPGGKKRKHGQAAEPSKDTEPESPPLPSNDSKTLLSNTVTRAKSDFWARPIIGTVRDFWERTTAKLVTRILNLGRQPPGA